MSRILPRHMLQIGEGTTYNFRISIIEASKLSIIYSNVNLGLGNPPY